MGEYPRATAAFRQDIDALVGDLQTERFGMLAVHAVMPRGDRWDEAVAGHPLGTWVA